MTRLRWDAFLVYDGPDRATAEALVSALSSRGIEVGWDDLVEPGRNWQRELPRMAEDCHVLLVLETGSEGWYKGPEVARLVDLARRTPDERRLIPVVAHRKAERTYGTETLKPLCLEDGLVAVADAVRRVVANIHGAAEPDEARRACQEELTELMDQRNAIEDTGGDASALTERIKGLKRQLRFEATGRAGDVLGDRFQLVEAIGHGGFGEVWRALDLDDRRRLCAVKVASPDRAGARRDRERFFRGARRMAGLDCRSTSRIGSGARKRYDDLDSGSSCPPQVSGEA